MSIPILTYHSLHIDGNEYEDNDMKALASDLRTISDAGFRITPLHALITQWLCSPPLEEQDVVALTCDDGSDFDFYDLPHPFAGMQRSALNVLHDFNVVDRGAQPRLHLTSFVVVSPEARIVMDRTCMIGRQWWNEDWWPKAIASGLMHIANHSWDHNHETLPEAMSVGVQRGTFTSINTKDLADLEIARAAAYLARNAPNEGTELFAYPYGESNDYLVSEYFPRYSEQLGIKAAFTDDAGYLSRGVDKWSIPRFMCGRDWKSPSELEYILRRKA